MAALHSTISSYEARRRTQVSCGSGCGRAGVARTQQSWQGRAAETHLLQGVLMPAPGGPEEVEDRDAHAFLWGLGRVLAPEAQEVMGAAVTAAA